MDPRQSHVKRMQRADRIRQSPSWNGRVFVNRHSSQGLVRPGGNVIARWLFERGEREPPAPLPSLTPEIAGPAHAGVRATWLGHSTVLVEIAGRRVLTDPVWAERASPVSWGGPRRFQPVPVALDALPPLDAVIVSHDHYDHLDRAAITALARRGMPIVTALGVGAHLERWGIDAAQVTELDWFETATPVAGLTLRALPSQHFSGRGVTDRNRTLWAAWSIEADDRRVFFGGDGGFDGATFAEIGERFGPFDLTMLEIGAFDPAWATVHLGPENAVRAHALLRGATLLPIHWGTFSLGLHAWDAPVEELLAAAPADVRLALPRIGGSFVVGGPVAREPWWRTLREPSPALVEPAVATVRAGR